MVLAQTWKSLQNLLRLRRPVSPPTTRPCGLPPLMSKRQAETLENDHLLQRPPQARKMAAEPATATINLTPEEARLKTLLLDVAKRIDKSQPGQEPVVLRWAGGWVRDKLLGVQSHDIDTAINTMTGEAFSSEMLAMCKQADVAEKLGVSDADIGNLHKIAANPEKSKHLETTTIRLFGFDVDFVNLRKETYTTDSRNPQMEFGTAEEDALRRDATINALFYNLNTGTVEDFTSGLRDKERKLIKTPLEPFQTFMDDPLRVLRLIRFASRLGFTIDEEAEKYMGDERVLDALRLKISRERIGVEVEKMLKGETSLGDHPGRCTNGTRPGHSPSDALARINKTGLYHTIFTDPNNTAIGKPDTAHWPSVYGCLDLLRHNETPASIWKTLVRTDEAAYYAWILAAVAPWAQVPEPPHKGKGKPPPPLATLAAREGIKAPNKVCDVITAAEKHREEIMSLKQAACEPAPWRNERDRFGMAIRQWEARGGQWKLQVLSALLVERMQMPAGADVEKLLAGWQTFLDHLRALDVMEAPSLKKMIDGTQLAKALGVKPGKWMAQALDVCVAWQLRNPEETDPSGAIEEVRSKKEELGI